MEKIIFFAFVIPILGFVLYLGGNAIMSGFKAKEDNKSNKKEENNIIDSTESDINQLSNEISKLDKLLQSGVINQEEFEKAKKKILDS